MLHIFNTRKRSSDNPAFGVISAIRDGNLKKVRHFVGKFGINAPVYSHILLCGALKFNRTEIVKFLLSNGADVRPEPGRMGPQRRGVLYDEYTPLHLAVLGNDPGVVRLLVERGALIDAIAGDRRSTALGDAVLFNKIDMVRTLLACGADVNIPNIDGDTPVQISAERRNIDVTKMLLQHGADMNAAFYNAAKGGNLNTLQFLLAEGANINWIDRDGLTLLHHGVESRQQHLIEFLLNRGADINARDSHNKSILCAAVETNCPIIVNTILKRGPLLVENQDAVASAFYCLQSSKHGRLECEIIESLLSYGFAISDRNAEDPKAFYVAIRHGFFTTLRILLRRSINLVNRLHNSVLSEILPIYPPTFDNEFKLANILVRHLADERIRCGLGLRPMRRRMFRSMHFELFQTLMTDKATIRNDPTLLKVGLMHGYVEIVKCALKYGADVNAQDSSGRAALHFCVLRPKNALGPILQRGRSALYIPNDVLEMLIAHGADMNARTIMGETPLHIAAQNNLLECINVLLKSGADVNAVDQHGTTPLHHFAYLGNLTMSEHLLNIGANVHARGKDEMTPLHVASERGHVGLVQSFLEYGANVNSNSAYGTPLHIACSEGRSDVVKFLLDYGADVNAIVGRNVIPIGNAFSRLDMGESRDFLIASFLQHLVKMKAADIFVSRGNLEYIKPGGFKANQMLHIHGISPALFRLPENFHEKCNQEVSVMKHMHIEDSNFSHYDILIGNDARLINLASSNSLKTSISSSDFESTFPIYASIIKRRFQKGVLMRELHEKCRDFVMSVAPQLPYLCVERILAFLTFLDMRVLVNAL